MSMFQRQGGTCHWENPGDGKPQGGKNKENQESAALSEASERSRLWRSAVRPGGRPRLISYSLSSSNHLHSPPRYYPPDHPPPLTSGGGGHPSWAGNSRSSEDSADEHTTLESKSTE